MQIRCRKCGTRFSVKDELVTEKGIKVRCPKCHTTFIVRKRVKPKEEPPPPPPPTPPREEEEPINLEALKELTEEKPFLKQFKEASLFLKILFIVTIGSCIAFSVYSIRTYLKLRVVEKSIYATVAIKYGYIEDAIKELKALIEKDPDNLSYNYLLATAYYILDDEKAKIYFEKVAELVDDTEVKGSLLIRAGRINRGIELLEEALPLSDDPQAVSNDLGIAYLEAGHTAKGLKYLKDAFEGYPFEVRFNRAVFAIKKNYKDGRKFVEEMYSYYPDKVEVLINTAVYYIEQKMYKRALQLLLMARGEHMFAPVVHHNIGIVYKLLKDERYRAYRETDIIMDDKPHIADYIFLLNPKGAGL